jgi:putative SOS response-associated peptidase YedK
MRYGVVSFQGAPASIHQHDHQRWLSAFPSPTNPLKPFPNELLEALPVNARAGNVRTEDRALILQEETAPLFL